jgi:hypothetical protein
VLALSLVSPLHAQEELKEADKEMLLLLKKIND